MIFSFIFIYIFVVNIVYYVVHIVCEVDVIANSLVLYLPFCSTLNKNFFSLSLSNILSTLLFRKHENVCASYVILDMLPCYAPHLSISRT